MSTAKRTQTDGPRRLREVPPSAPHAGTGAAAQRERTGERSFFCRTCLIAATGRWVPTGWYMVERSVGGSGTHRRLGLYCSLECLMGAREAFEHAEAAHNRLIGLADDPARARERLVETAQTLLATGMSVRAVGDELGVPTKALRAMLTAAGLELPAAPPPDGTPTAAGSKNPLMLINELVQRGRLREVIWSVTNTGPAHRPVFTARVGAEAWSTAGWKPVSVQGQASSKAAARTAAAEALAAALTDPAQTQA
jgi:hypothetical protein